MQITTDISPIISPKSNFSNSFMSPRDLIFASIKVQPTSIEKSPNDNNMMSRIDLPSIRAEFEASQQANNTTNESYSVDRNYNARNNSNHIPSLSSQHYVNETNRESEAGEGISRQMENVQIIEYEEFYGDRSAKDARAQVLSEFSSVSGSLNTEQLRDKAFPQEEQQQQQDQQPDPIAPKDAATSLETAERTEKELPSPKNTGKKFLFNFMDGKDGGSARNEGPLGKSSSSRVVKSGNSSVARRRQDPFDLPLQDSQNRYRHDNSSHCNDVSKGDSINKDPSSMKNSFHFEIESKLDHERNESGSRAGSVNLEELVRELRDQLRSRDDEIGYFKARVRYLEERRTEKPEESRVKSDQAVAKEEKGTSTTDLQSLEKDRQYREQEQAIKDSESLRTEIKKMSHDQQEGELKNMHLKETIAQQKTVITQIEEHCARLETNLVSTQSELQSKSHEIHELVEERKLLTAKKTKLKNVLRQRDQFIADLKHQNMEASQFKQTDNYQTAIEKMQSYKEKNNQLHKYIEGQKDAIKKKDTAIDNLLIKMDSLADSNQAKSNEILTLKSEMKHLQERLDFVKRDHKTTSFNLIQSHKGSMDNLTQHFKEKSGEKLGGMTKKHEEVERFSLKDPISKRKLINEHSNARTDCLNGKTIPTVDSHGTARRSEEVFKSATVHENHDYEGLKLRERTPDPDNLKHFAKYGALKASDLDTKGGRHDNDKEIQNLEDLQKRLAYLKTKRIEFEKRRHAKQKERGDPEEARQLEKLHHSQPFGEDSGHMQESAISPLISAKRSEDRYRTQNPRDKESATTKYNNYLLLDEHTPTGRDQLMRNQSNLSDGNNSRPASKTRPPKIDNHQQFNNRSDNNYSVKSGIRYSSLSNNPSTVKHETSNYSTKNHKKSYDASSRVNDIFKFSESPGKVSGTRSRGEKERSSSRPKDVRDFLSKGSVTPNSNLHTRLSEKIVEGKQYRK